jgi:hypothetical protein
MGRFFRHEHLTDEEIATIRERAAAIDDDLLSRSEREAKAGARVIFWGEANAPVLKQDEGDLIRRGGIVAKNNTIYLGAALASWHLESTPPLENKIVLIRPDGTPAWEFSKRTRSQAENRQFPSAEMESCARLILPTAG